jgi:hypothetical protein
MLAVGTPPLVCLSRVWYFYFDAVCGCCKLLQAKLREQQSRHTTLIDNFDASLRALSSVPLHPALRAAIEDYQSTALGSSTTSAGSAAAVAANATGTTGTLLDCIPVDREKVFLSQCAANHRKVSCGFPFRGLYIHHLAQRAFGTSIRVPTRDAFGVFLPPCSALTLLLHTGHPHLHPLLSHRWRRTCSFRGERRCCPLIIPQLL